MPETNIGFRMKFIGLGTINSTSLIGSILGPLLYYARLKNMIKEDYELFVKRFGVEFGVDVVGFELNALAIIFAYLDLNEKA